MYVTFGEPILPHVGCHVGAHVAERIKGALQGYTFLIKVEYGALIYTAKHLQHRDQFHFDTYK